MSWDPIFIRYIETLETHLGRLRGKERALSPPEFALARHWYRAGIPVALITQCLETAGTGTLSLIACSAQIEALVRARCKSGPPD
jgi:hypothetical protein